MKKLLGLVLALVLTVGCGSTKFVNSTYGTLATFTAAYTVEEAARETFCKPKTPQPPVCVTAWEAAYIGWTAFIEASDLLAVYIETKSQDAKAQIVRLVPEIVSSAVELTNAVDELKRVN